MTQIQQVCPLCQGTQLVATDQVADLGDIMKRWEVEGQVTFSPSVLAEYAPQQITLYQCKTCGLGLFQPVITGSQGFYNDITAKEYYVSEKWEFLQGIRDLNKNKCRSLLDIGCGSGFFLEMVRDRVPTITEAVGYEFSPDVAALANSRGHVVYSGPFPDTILDEHPGCQFDAVTMFQIIEHVADPAAMFQGAQRLLRPGGLLIVGVPNAAGPLRHFSTHITDMPPHHVTRWRKSVFHVAMKRFGFRVLKVANEPLPHYLWDFYLPIMLEQDFRPHQLGHLLNQKQFVPKLTHLLRRYKVKWLRGVPGHTIYVVLENIS